MSLSGTLDLISKVEDPLENETATHSSLLAEKLHGQRSLAGYSPLGHKDSDTTEHIYIHLYNHTYLCVYMYIHTYI